MRITSDLLALAFAAALLAACPGGPRPDGGADGAIDATGQDARLDVTGTDTVVPDTSLPGPFGAPCVHDTDCSSGICLSVGSCSRTCSSGGDCPMSTNWSCVGLPGRGTVCDCTRTSASDLPCNSVDDECNGLIDDTSRTCNGACVDVGADPANCGACGITCGGGTVCRAGRCDCPTDRPSVCGTRCIATATDPMHCGSCGHVCPGGANGTASCAAGVCGITCNAGSADCDADAANGCEADVRSDLMHCGSCGHVCAFANATGTCSTGSCVLGACAAGYQNCDGDPSNGCEADVASSTTSCGACGRACVAPNGVSGCTAGVCGLLACNPGWANCNTVATDGCEVALGTDVLNCGVCGHACPGGGPNTAATCMASTCGLACRPGFGDCDTSTANGCETVLQSDVANCGACGVTCGTGLTCSGGACGVACGGVPGYSLCGSACVNLSTDPGNCGGCGVPCASPNVCTAGTCVCAAGLTACSGACVNLTRDTNHCGTCGTRCAAPPPNASAVCTTGACAVACNTGFGDCDTSRVNGCETNTDSNVSACGACGNVCAAGSTCVAGRCGLLVNGLGGPAGFGANRLPLQDDGSNCGTGMTGVDLTVVAPSGLNFYGTIYRQLCVNNNGNVNFTTTNMGVNTFTSSPFPFSSVPLIAPWFADVDTRGGNLSNPNTDAIYWDARAGQFVATWYNVGYYATHDNLQNTFQLVLRDRTDVAPGDFDIEFRYQRCEWTTGDASGGTGGTGGTPALAGIDSGNRVNAVTLPGSQTTAVLMLCTTSNVAVPGVWRYRIRGGMIAP